jgi:hypothetical protein
MDQSLLIILLVALLRGLGIGLIGVKIATEINGAVARATAEDAGWALDRLRDNKGRNRSESNGTTEKIFWRETRTFKLLSRHMRTSATLPLLQTKMI